MSTHTITLVVDNGARAGSLASLPQKTAVGFGDSVEAAIGRMRSAERLFSCLAVPVWAGRTGEPQGSAGASPVRQPVRSVHHLAMVAGSQSELRLTTMHQLALGAAAPAVSLHDGQAVTTSLDVAAYFGKRHERVLDSIRTLAADLPRGNEHNFVSVDYTDAKGEKRPAYRLTRDGFTLLAMGFTGKRALAFKLAYIAAFNRMEAELTKGQLAQAGRSPLQGRWCLNYIAANEPVRLTRIEDETVMLNPKDAADLERVIRENVPADLLPRVIELALSAMQAAMPRPAARAAK